MNNKRMYDALLAIAYMDVYTRPGEEPAHEVMRKIALRSLEESKEIVESISCE